MREWFKKYRSQIIVGAFIVIVLGGSTVSALIANTDNQAEAPEPISVEQQVFNVAASSRMVEDVSYDDIVEAAADVEMYQNNTENVAALLAIDVVPVTEFVRSVEEGPVAFTHFNSEKGLVATAFGNLEDTENKPQVLAAYYLPAQEESILAALENSGSDITVVNTSGPATVNTIPGRTYYNPAIANSGAGNPAAVAPATSGGSWLSTLVSIVVILLLIWIVSSWIRHFITRRNAGKAISKQVTEVPETRFSDVAGCEEAIADMHELVDFLKTPEKFTSVGAQIPRGGLLVGPPGTGKTLLARAVAGEAGVPFYSAAGSDFVEMYVGVGAKRVRELFAKARKHEEGAIIFIDEIDAIGRKRSEGASSAGNTEVEGTLNAMLVEMDGFTKSNIIVLAATNRDDILDKALTRPGRLDRKIHVPLPDRLGREKILAVHGTGKPFSSDVDWSLIARRTPGMSGADLAQIVNEACLVAARDGRAEVTNTDLDSAVATVAMGKARTSAVVSEHDRKVTAWHEAGHTLAAMLHPDADNPVSVSIIPRGPAGGVTWMAEGDDIFLTRKRAYARLVVAMGGRAAEEIYLDGEFTSGPHGDLTQATNVAYAMVTQYGMTDTGLMVRHEALMNAGTKLADETVEAVERLLAEALHSARSLLRSNRDLLERIVHALLENDTLVKSELDILAEGYSVKDLPRTPQPPTDYRKKAPRVRRPSTSSIPKVVEATEKDDSVGGILVNAIEALIRRRKRRLSR